LDTLTDNVYRLVKCADFLLLKFKELLLDLDFNPVFYKYNIILGVIFIFPIVS